MRRALVSAAILAWLAGCATVPAAPPVAHPAPPPSSSSGAQTGTKVGSTASGGSITANTPQAPAVVDSTPSEDALAVLSTIPDPLGRPTSPESASVPVQAPTEPLGDRSKASATAPDAAAPPLGAPAAPPAAGAATGAAAASKPDSCWRVQVAAPPERDRADAMARAAQSQLGVPFVVEHEGGLYKVRTRDCLTSAKATALKDRAVADGFDGSFRFLRPRS
jgi:hypothetical protein